MSNVLERPDYMPEGEPRILLDVSPLEYHKVHPVGFNDENNDGVIDYYDQPLLFLAFINEQRVIVTLLDEGYASSGMQDGYAKDARGWTQYIACPVDDEMVTRVVSHKANAHDYMKNNANWFIHYDWASLCIPDLDRRDKNQWYTVYRVFENVPIKDEWKPEKESA